jgi:hypothetical protein
MPKLGTNMCDGWGWYPPQTASQIWARHIQSDWAIDMLPQGHMGAPIIPIHRPSWPKIWTFGSLVEWKWCHYVLVEADIHLRLLPTSTLDIYNVIELLVFCLNGIWMHPCIVIPAKVAPDFGIWVICGVKMMPLHHGWGCYPPQTASHIHIRHMKCVWGIVCCLKGLWVHPYTVILAKLAPDFELLSHLWSGNDAITWWLRLISTSDCFPNLS